MLKTIKPFLATAVAAIFITPIQASADQVQNVFCSIVVDVLKPGGATESYQNNFYLQPGSDFFDDFSTATRIKEFSASLGFNAGKTNVTINYFNDVGVFDSIEFGTTYTLPRNREPGTVTGRSAAYTSNGNFIADYSLSCNIAK